MAPVFRHGKGASFELDSTAGSLVNLSSGLDDITFSREMNPAEVTSFGDGDHNYIGGLRGATISCAGSWASTYANVLDGIFANVADATRTFKYCPESTASGRHTLTGECFMTTLEYGATVDDKVSMSFDLLVTGVVTSTNE